MTKGKLKSIELFYTPPKDRCFEELRKICIRFWEVYDDFFLWSEHGQELMDEYKQSKINQIKDLKNEGANFAYMVQMIHENNRKVIAKCLSMETRNEISMRLYGFDDNKFDPFNIWNVENNK